MKVVVLGDDLSAIASTYLFQKEGFQTLLLGDVNSKGEIFHEFSYMRNTPDVVDLLQELDVLYSSYIVRGGIMLHEKIYPYPKHFKNLDDEHIKRIRYDYFRKTRKIVVSNPVKAFVKPIATKTKTAIRSDSKELFVKLFQRIKVVREKVRRIELDHVVLRSGTKIFFDKLIVACPVWELKRVASWFIPDVLAMRSHLACLVAKGDVYGKYDYIYTPYTPANCVHFVSNDGEFFFAEMSGHFDQIALESDLNFLFKRGWYLCKIYKNLKGYTLPTESDVNWPKNVHPIGSYSLWSDHFGFDDTLRESKRLAEEWNGLQKLAESLGFFFEKGSGIQK